MSGSIDDDDAFLSAMADACKEAECQSPIPGPLEKATTWVRLAELGGKLEQRVYLPEQHHVLQVVREWSLLLLAWLCVGVYEWCVGRVEPSTHSLLATHPPGRGGAGPLLRSRLAVKRNIRGAQREWKKDGAKWAPGPDSAMRQACSTHLMKVRQIFAKAPVLELCFDASQVSIRNHDIFAVYAPTGFGGASENSAGVSSAAATAAAARASRQ